MIRTILAVVLLVAGLGCHCVSVLGIFRLPNILQRLHSASVGDTLALLLSLLGVGLLFGNGPATGKLIIILLFMWLGSALSTHLIAKVELLVRQGRTFNGEEEPE